MSTGPKLLALILMISTLGGGCSYRRPAAHTSDRYEDEKRSPEKHVTFKDETHFMVRENGHKIIETASRVFENKAHRKLEIFIDGESAGSVVRIEGDSYVAHRKGDHAAILYRGDRDRAGLLRIVRDAQKGNRLFEEWHRQSKEDERYPKKKITIVSVDENGEELRLTFHECLPVGWTGPDKNVMSEAHFTETLELSFEKMQRK